MLQLVKQITAAGVVSLIVPQMSVITTASNKALCLCLVNSVMCDMGVAMVDFAILIVYTACVG